MKKILIIAIIGMVAFSCAEKKPSTPGVDGKKIFKQNCVICHGANGKLGLNNSKDLTVSKLTVDERKAIIKNGKGVMAPFGNVLKPAEIQAVAEYTFKLK